MGEADLPPAVGVAGCLERGADTGKKAIFYNSLFHR